jgi:hypothetical protein
MTRSIRINLPKEVRLPCDRRLTSVPITIEVVKISFPQGLVLISIIQLRCKIGFIKVILFATRQLIGLIA